MSQQPSTMITCPNCGTNFAAQLQQIVDVQRNPSAKGRFLSGQVNLTQCPNCQFTMNVGTPLAYHDGDKELLLIHIPQEMNLSNDEQEKIVGQFTRTITDSLPMEKRKGYLFNPRRTLTLQGMMDTVLEADGITKEMINQRREQVQFIETFLRAEPNQLPQLAVQHDEKLDAEFFEAITSAAEAAMMQGQQEAAQHILNIRNILLENTTYGKEIIANAERQEAAVQQVVGDLQKLGDQVSHEKLIELAIDYEHEDEQLQAFVGLVRPLLNYEFFEKLTAHIDSLSKAKKQRRYERLRERILELTQQVDEQQQALVQQSAAVLQQIINSPNIEQAVRDSLPAIDEMFMSIVEANMQQAQQTNNTQLIERLMQVQQALQKIVQESSPPEIQFINDLLSEENELQVQIMLMEQAKAFGETLLQYMDQLVDNLRDSGQDELADRIVALRQKAEKIISADN